jgi:cyclin B
MLIDLTSDPFEDIDANDRNDPTCCTEYVNEIFEYCHSREIMDRVRPDYMSDQVDITERMRAILVDWMVEVHVKFKLLTETMFLSVNLVDRFLAVKPITRTKLQLVGIAAMLLASKYEEIYSPELRDFIHIADKAYTQEEILRMERLMLTTLDFNLSACTPLHFLRRFSKASKSDSRMHTLSKYLSELTLTEYNMLKYLPSHIAAASVYVARCMTGRSPWSTTLEHYAGLREEEFAECARDLNTVLKKALAIGAKLGSTEKTSGLIFAVYKKYSSDRLLSVAKLPAVEI